jgi:branched-chain amino acid aminotransferase
VSAAIVKTAKNIPAALPPQIKSTNFLNGILAKIEAKNRGAYEGFMLDAEGYVAEGTISNIFIVKSGKVMTPPRHNILPGITRETVLSLAKKRGIRAEEALVAPDRLYEAEECFITSSIMELVPVVTVDGKKIGTGAPGKMTSCLLEAYRALARGDEFSKSKKNSSK